MAPPPCVPQVLTITKAAEQLVNFLTIMLLMIVCASEMHMTIFGVYTDSYETFGEAVLVTFMHFAIGQELDLASGEYSNSPVGYVFLYLFSALTLLLVLSQFFIAILVASWDAAAELKQSLREATALPAGFTKRPQQRTITRRLLETLIFFLTGYCIDARAMGVHIAHALNHCMLTLEWNLRKRRAKSEALQAAGGVGCLSENDEKVQFLFENGLAGRKDVRDGLLVAGLSEHTADYVLDMYLPPGAADHKDPQRAHKASGVDAVMDRLKRTIAIREGSLVPDEEAEQEKRIRGATTEQLQAIVEDVSDLKGAFGAQRAALDEMRPMQSDLKSLREDVSAIVKEMKKAWAEAQTKSPSLDKQSSSTERPKRHRRVTRAGSSSVVTATELSAIPALPRVYSTEEHLKHAV